MSTIVCPWCGTRYSEQKNVCDNCGGQLPLAEPQNAGTPPPMPPRQLPASYVRRIRFSKNVLSIVGTVFLPLGIFFSILFPTIAVTSGEQDLFWFGLIFGGIFTLVGAILLFVGLRQARRKLRALREGRATTGKVVDLYRDRTVKINGRSPMAIIYQFDVSNQQLQGKTTAWHLTPEGMEIGSPIHVLYLPEDPDQNTTYPPLS